MKKRLVIFSSLTGTNFESIVTACQQDKLAAEVVLLVTHKSTAPVVERARRLNIPVFVANPAEFLSSEAWDHAITREVQSQKPDLVVLAGFIKKLGPQFVAELGGKTINSHPSLLPKYGGVGMYGTRVHQAVLAAKEKVTGISIHYIGEDYDDGRVVAQIEVPVLATDTAESLEKRVKATENTFFVETLQQLLK